MPATAAMLVTAPTVEPMPADRLKRARVSKNADRVNASRTAAARQAQRDKIVLENLPLVKFCTSLLDRKTAYQYEREERTLLLRRADSASQRLDLLIGAMSRDAIAPEENVLTLRQGLAEHFDADEFLACESMGALLRENLRQARMEDKLRASAFAG